MRLILRLLKLSRPAAGWLALGSLAALVALVANVALLAVSGWFVTAMGVAGAAGRSMNYFTPASLIRLFAILRTLGRYAERVITHEATFRLIASLRVWLFRRIEPLSPPALAAWRSGDLGARLRTDLDRLETVYLRLISPLAVALVGGAVLVAWLSRYSAPLAWLEAVLLLLAGLLGPLAVARLCAPAARRQVTEEALLNAAAVDLVQGMPECLVFGAEAAQLAAFDAHSRALVRAQVQNGRAGALAQSLLMLCAALALWSAIVLAVPLLRGGAIDGADLVMLALACLGGFEAVASLPGALQGLGGVLESARRIFAIADAAGSAPGGTIRSSPRAAEAVAPSQPRVLEGTTPPKAPAAEMAVQSELLAAQSPMMQATLPAACDIAVSGLTYTYPGASAPALRDFGLTLRQGQRIAITGPIGCGKSTLILLLTGLVAPDRGSITLGGHPAEDMDDETRRGCFAVAPQDPGLFSGTIRYALRLADRNADDAALWRALRTAQLDQEIAAQPDGLDTWIGEAGLTLSGGQAKRLAVARALPRHAPVLILDEPTEGLDATAAEALLRAVVADLAGRSLLLITHGKAGLGLMDAVVALPGALAKPPQGAPASH
jgi:ATP-binding cassette subfamily C protein CydC